jgi:predicted permease
VILVALAVIGATAVGITSEHRFRSGARVAAQRTLAVMLYVLVPFVSYVNIAHLHVTAAGGVGLGFGWVMVAIVAVSAWAIGRFRLHLDDDRLGAVICCVVVVNSGYLGLPTVVALLGSRSLGHAVAYDQLISGPSLFLIGFGVGAAFGNAVGLSWRARIRVFLTRNPPLLAVVAGLLASPSLAPRPLPQISHVVVDSLLVLGFFAVGVYLSSERREDGAPLLERPDSPVLLVIGLRMLVAPLIVFALSTAVLRLPSAYFLQAAMPTGLSSLIVGHAYGLDQRLIATIIVWSTAVALVAGLTVAAL